MPLTNTQLRYYDSNVLRLSPDKRKGYHEQVDRLIEELSRSVRDKTEIRITRVVKAGSFAKFTILRKTSVDRSMSTSCSTSRAGASTGKPCKASTT
jgi:hypothetical protein